jgi:hypothetical protein
MFSRYLPMEVRAENRMAGLASQTGELMRKRLLAAALLTPAVVGAVLFAIYAWPYGAVLLAMMATAIMAGIGIVLLTEPE